MSHHLWVKKRGSHGQRRVKMKKNEDRESDECMENLLAYVLFITWVAIKYGSINQIRKCINSNDQCAWRII
jgi:hypothetical protein